MESLFSLPDDLSTYERKVRRHLADSLGYLSGWVDLPDGLRLAEKVRSSLEKRQQSPVIFARYLDLVAAVQGGDKARATRLFVEISQTCDDEVGFEIVPFSVGELGDDYARFPQILFTKDYGIQPIIAVSDEKLEMIRSHLESGLALLSQIAPSVRREIEILWRRIYIGGGNADAAGRQFAGVTSFLLWGATFLNADAYRTAEQAVEFLVHESTHGLLFALSCEEPLVLNRIEERYPSPLRSDPRPMDGIYHATLVSARVAQVYAAWLESDEAGDRDAIKRRIEASRRAFADGSHTIAAHAQLSPHGRELHAEASAALAQIS